MKYIKTSLLALSLLSVSHGLQAADNRLALEHFFSDDTDGAEYRKYLAGYDRLFSDEQYLGFRIGTRNYHEDIAPQEKDFDEFRIAGQKQLGDNITTNLGLSFLSGDNWDPVLFDINLVYKATERLRLESFIQREVIDAIAAINDKNYHMVAGVVTDYAFTQEYTLVAGLTQQRFTDHNKKHGWLMQFIYSPAQLNGVHFKLEGKANQSKFDPADYFAPDSHEQYFALLRYVRRFADNQRWLFKFEGGPGIQYINNESEDALKYRLDLEGSLTDATQMKLFYGCTSDGGDEDYEYCFGGANLYYLW